MAQRSDRDPFAPPPFEPEDPDLADRLLKGVSSQPFLTHLGVEMLDLGPGRVTLALEMRPELAQNFGFAHGGVTATLLDAAIATAAGSLLEKGGTVLTVEMKMNLVAPAKGVRLLAHGRVLKPGRRLTIAESRVFGVAEDGVETLAATALGTLMTATKPRP